MRLKQRAIWMIIFAVLYGAWTVSPASAHAELARSIPEANAILEQSPSQIELVLSEPIESKVSTIKVFDSNGQEVDAGKPVVGSGDPELITRSLVPLPDGIYTVSWVVLSVIDGHLSAGSFPFAVGQVDASALPEIVQTTTNMPIGGLIAKWLLLAAAAILAGGYPSMVLIWRPIFEANNQAQQLKDHFFRSWHILLQLTWASLLISSLLGILEQAGQAGGREFAFPWTNEALQLLTGSRLGVLWLVRLAFALFGLWMIRNNSADKDEPAQFILGLALLMTISLTSHAATELHPLLPVLNDWLHLIAMSVWFGGLAYLIAALRVLRNTDGDLCVHVTSTTAKRFSSMALPAVGVIGLTGIYSATLRVGSMSALVDTMYGHSLLFKQGFVAALLLIAATNLLIISPGLRRDAAQNIAESKYFTYFGRTVLTEVILACLLLVNVTVMTYLPPARTPFPPTTLNGTSSVDDLKVALFISPGLPGSNTFIVRLSPRRAIDAAQGVTLTFVPVNPDVPPSEIQLIDMGNGLYTAQGSHVAFPGRWLVEVAVQRKNTFTAQVGFDFNVTQANAVVQSDKVFFPQLSKFLMGLIILLIVANLFFARSRITSHI